MQNDGKLTQDTFAVAMHLINGKLAGKPIPDRIPDSLVPPSQRQQAGVRPQTQAPMSQITRDLFELDNSPPTSPNVPEHPTGGAFGSQGILKPQSTGTPAPAFPQRSGSAFTTPPVRSQQQSPFAPAGKA